MDVLKQHEFSPNKNKYDLVSIKDETTETLILILPAFRMEGRFKLLVKFNFILIFTYLPKIILLTNFWEQSLQALCRI